MKREKPTTPGQRGMITSDYKDLTKKKPEKSLTKSLHRKMGRSKGKITSRHRGGGHKKLYRNVDFKQNNFGEILTIISIEYDPHRNSYVALVRNEGGVKKYILAYEGIKTGDKITENRVGFFHNFGLKIPLLPSRLLPPKAHQTLKSFSCF